MDIQNKFKNLIFKNTGIECKFFGEGKYNEDTFIHLQKQFNEFQPSWELGFSLRKEVCAQYYSSRCRLTIIINYETNIWAKRGV